MDGLNKVFPIYNEDGTSFNGLVLHKATVDSVVMSLGDKISGDVYYRNNYLNVTMNEYVVVDDVKYRLVNPPTIVREGMVSDNSELRGMTKYSFEFYHPMYLLSNFTFSDIAVDSSESLYLSQSRSFSWIGTLSDFVAKLNANLNNTEWIVVLNATGDDVITRASKKSDVLTFQNQFISDALKTAYDTWEVPFVISPIEIGGDYYAQGKRFIITFGLPTQEIYVVDGGGDLTEIPFVFRYGQGVGLKNDSRNPRNNKIVTRIIGYGSEDNIPYGYPQIRWWGTQGLDFTYGDRAGVFNNVTISGHTFDKIISYPIYKGILGGQYVELIKHPYTRKNLMPLVYRESLFNKVSYLNEDGTINEDYNPDIELVDYYDAIGNDYPNNIVPQSPSSEIHQFEDIKPMLALDGEYHIVSATPLNSDMTPASGWDDTMDDNGEYVQSYFKIKLPILPFDIYACAAVTQEMQINMRSGACMGCTFNIQVDWDDYKRNFYTTNGDFDPAIHTTDGDGHVRNGDKYPNSHEQQIDVIVQKDNETFGTLMPNMFQYPLSGDDFVILGISLPNEYISNAETRLSLEMQSYMKENNDYYYDYPLKFDEYFLATNNAILSQLKNNKIVRFSYAGNELQLYVKQITIKYGEDVLPKYDITLTDNIDVVLNKIGQAMEDIRHLNDDLLMVRQNTQTTFNRIISSDKGKIGRFYYYAQEWIDTDLVSYVVNEVQAPYFSYNNEFWVFNPKENGTYTLSDMGTPHENSVDNPSDWVRMLNEFKYIMTDAIFANYAHFGSAIINGDWLISQHGTINGVASTDYVNFQPQFIDSIYLCVAEPISGTSSTYKNLGSKSFIGGNQYTIKISFEGNTSQSPLHVVMWNGTENVGNGITIDNFSTISTLTFTPQTDGIYYIRAKYQQEGLFSCAMNAYVDGIFIPNYAVDLLTGKSYENALNAKGTIHANMIYTNVKNLNNETTTYTVDLNNNPYNCFVKESPNDLTINLPKAKDYDGLELQFMEIVSTRIASGDTLLHCDDNGIIYNNDQNVMVAVNTVQLISNKIVVLKSIFHSWYVIQGNVESYVI